MGTITRRTFLHIAAGTGVAAAAISRPRLLVAAKATGKGAAEVEVTPVEDLMREHGVLSRVLLIYEEWMERLEGNEVGDIGTLAGANGIVRSFVQDYHEKLEEEYVFPRLASISDDMADLANLLMQQHEAGRRLIDVAMSLSKRDAIANEDDRSRLGSALGGFTWMYRPHASREDTVAFPAFHRAVQRQEYESLGDRFEKREKDLFGEDGFAKMVARVTAIEQALGIYDLAEFTAKV